MRTFINPPLDVASVILWNLGRRGHRDYVTFGGVEGTEDPAPRMTRRELHTPSQRFGILYRKFDMFVGMPWPAHPANARKATDIRQASILTIAAPPSDL
jgi:hypothetical protein